MQKTKSHPLFLKISIIVIIAYLTVVTISLAVTGFLFFTLDFYKPKVEKIIYKRTGYKLNLGNIKTTFNRRWLPQIVMNDISLSDKIHHHELFRVKSIKLIISYASIWHFQPIFDTIVINGTTLTLSRTTDNKFLLNGLPFPENKLTRLRPHQFNTEEWLLKSSHIKLSQITFNFVDDKNILPNITMPNLNALLDNSYFSKHTLNVTIPNITAQNTIDANLTWTGNKISEPNKWSDGEFILQTYTNTDTNTDTNNSRNNNSNNNVDKLPNELTTITRLFSGADIFKKLNAKTTATAKIVDGKLTIAQANFDFKDLTLPFKIPMQIPLLTGNIFINLINNTEYRLNATNLSIATKDGYILRNQKIIGNYKINQGGIFTINDIMVTGFNNLLHVFPTTSSLDVKGQINSISASWLGNILKPTNYQLSTKFQDLTVISKNNDIPSIDNISGEAMIAKDHGKAHIILKNSTLTYSKIFLIPYRFKFLDTTLLWNDGTNKTWTVTLQPTKLSLIDFDGSINGKYIYQPNTSGFLELHAHLNRILTSKVGDYLPTQIPMSVHKWLNMGLVGGYGANATLLLEGWLTDFPFSNNKGKFYIDADIENAKLNYVDTWPTLDKINGKFQIRNQKIIIKTNNAHVSNNHITKGLVIIPDMTSNNAYLTADGIASGETSNFMTYLKHSPINALIGKIPEKVATSGNGNVNIHLNVPFDNPEHTRVNGFYTFNNNSLQFLESMKIPLLSNVNGKLFFTDHSITIDNITTNALGANVDISAVTAANNRNMNIHFKAIANSLDYGQAANYYLPFLSPLISGTATTNITFDIDGSGNGSGLTRIQANSQLQNVTITAAAPVAKAPTVIAPLEFTMLAKNNGGFNINFTYNNILFGNLVLNNQGNLADTNIALGTKEFIVTKHNYSVPLKINTNLPSINLFAWLGTIEEILKSPKVSQSQVTKALIASTTITKSPHTQIHSQSHAQLFPIEVYLNTNALFLGSSNYGKTRATCTINNIKNTDINARFDITGAQINGYGTYSSLKNLLDLNLYNLRISKSETITNLTKHHTAKDQILKPRAEWAIPPECKAIITTPTPTPQDASIADKIAQKCYYALRKLRNHDNKLLTQQHKLQNSLPPVDLPIINLKSNQLVYDKDNLGQLAIKLVPQKQDLVLESGKLIGKNATLTFSGANYCMKCGSPDSFVALKGNITVPDFGNFLDELGLDNIIKKGNGTITIRTQWDGQFSDFNIGDTIAHINMDIKSGQFLKADTNSVLGSILGIITLQTIVQIVKLDFGSIFSSGFSFSSLKLNAYLIKNNLSIKYLRMVGTLAVVTTYGNLDLAKDNLDLYLSVTPQLDSSVALSTAIATAPTIIGPVIVGVSYALDWILGKPFNKLFTFSYHVTGTVEKPILTKISISKQIAKNVGSTVRQ